MQIDLEALRRHYASLSDEALSEIDRSDLVDLARQCYDVELARRHVNQTEGRSTFRAASVDRPDASDWLDGAACVCTFPVSSVHNPNYDDTPARTVLESAGIPCHLELCQVAPDPEPAPQSEYRLMVPGEFNLEASCVLNKEIYNERMVDGWRAHLTTLSDEQLLAATDDDLYGDLVDRLERMKRAYDEEVARRRSRTRS